MRPAQKSLFRPDQELDFDHVHEEIVELGDITVGRITHQPGWRWSTHLRPVVGTETCQARHLGFVQAGRMAVLLPDRSIVEVEPGSAYDLPPGHDAWVIGDEPLVVVEWAGAREWLQRLGTERVLVTLLLTDIVGSTARARDLGDRAWRRLLGHHNEVVRDVLARYRGREVATTGDGILAIFPGPLTALEAAASIRDRVTTLGLQLRQGVHVGEVDLVDGDVRGIAVHEVARIAAAAGPGQILVSDIARALVGPELAFEPRGEHELKGASPRLLFALA